MMTKILLCVDQILSSETEKRQILHSGLSEWSEAFVFRVELARIAPKEKEAKSFHKPGYLNYLSRSSLSVQS